VISGNGVQLPVHLPVNITGNSVNVVGIGNPATGNESVNTPGDAPGEPPQHPAPKPPTSPAPPKAHPGPKATVPRQPVASLAHTGTDLTLPAAAGSATLLLGGAALYRRFRPGAER